MGRVCLPEMKRYNYDPGLATGTVAAGGTLGILIPPSTAFVIYGILTEQSIGRLLLAGILAGHPARGALHRHDYDLDALAPRSGPARSGGHATGAHRKPFRGPARWWRSWLISIGGIYLGVFTPSEAAAIGAFLSLAYALYRRSLGGGTLATILLDTVKTTSFVFLILIGAFVFGPFLALSGLPEQLAQAIAGLPVPRMVILIILMLIYVLLGMFLEGFSILVLTMPIVIPIMTVLQFDLIWFGVLMVIVLEMGLISPPVGINVFVVKGLVPDVPMGKIFKGILPFWVAMGVCLALIIAFPDIALLIPNSMIGK